MTTCDHLVPDIPPLVAEFIEPTQRGRTRHDGDLVVTVLTRYPPPKVITIGVKRPEPGQCPVCVQTAGG